MSQTLEHKRIHTWKIPQTPFIVLREECLTSTRTHHINYIMCNIHLAYLKYNFRRHRSSVDPQCCHFAPVTVLNCYLSLLIRHLTSVCNREGLSCYSCVLSVFHFHYSSLPLAVSSVCCSGCGATINPQIDSLPIELPPNSSCNSTCPC